MERAWALLVHLVALSAIVIVTEACVAHDHAPGAAAHGWLIQAESQREETQECPNGLVVCGLVFSGRGWAES
jgi:hypothetical protein